MGGRPSKPIGVIQQEGKSHRTNGEIEQRKQAEASLLTGMHMLIWPEVKSNKLAKLEFERVSDLLSAIDKDDALHEAVVNRYCLLRAECVDFEKKREMFMKSMADLKHEYKANKLEASQYFKLITAMQKSIVGIDRQIMSKRSMMLAIEKENLMTIASALRSIPKQAEKPKQTSGMAGFIKRRVESG